ncbi:MAG: LytTR family transcriptional regulator DNA-binding domain-containing protein [Bacillota bacterium]|nr:LytTR family transcriptional regulator DNA-binding domain-containing protein [Bacillota bacterium]
MIKLIFVDDDRFSLEMFSAMAKEAAQSLGITAEVSCLAGSGEEVMRYLKDSQDHFLCFVDYEIGDNHMNGIEIAKSIHDISMGNKVVFVTSHGEKNMEILKSGAQPFGFIEKNMDMALMKREFKDCIYKASSMLEKDDSPKSTNTIELRVGVDDVIRISTCDVVFVEAVKQPAHNICWHTIDGNSITVRDSLDNALEMLGDGFAKCHRSVIVNKACVIGKNKGTLKLSDGESVECSIRHWKEFDI